MASNTAKMSTKANSKKRKGQARTAIREVPVEVATSAAPKKTCCICMDTVEEEESAESLCPRVAEHPEGAGICKACLAANIAFQIGEGFPGKCPPITCPLDCHAKKAILSYRMWAQLVSDELVQKFNQNATSLTYFLCGGCHNSRPQGVLHDAAAPRAAVLDSVPEAVRGEFEGDLAAYEAGTVTAEEFHAQLSSKYFPSAATDADEAAAFAPIKSVLQLIADPERRLSLQIRHLWLRPSFKTMCCNRVHCWKCKTVDFHHGKTCEEVASQSLDNTIVACPQCGISLTKGDGCSSVTCFCGRAFNWSHEKELTERSARFSAAHPINTAAAVADTLCSTAGGDVGGAQAWRTRHPVESDRALLSVFRAHYAPYPSQCCATMTFDTVPGYRIASDLWIKLHEAEVAKARAEVLRAKGSYFETMVPNKADRAWAAHCILRRIYGARVPTSDAYAMHTQHLADSARMWANKYPHNAKRMADEEENCEKRAAQQFLYLHGSKLPTSTAPACCSAVPRPAQWDKHASDPMLQFSDENATVCRPGSMSCYPAAFAELPASRSAFVVEVKYCCLESNTLSFGLARRGMQRTGSDGVGRTVNSWGIYDERNASGAPEAEIFSNRSRVRTFRKIRQYDRLAAVVDVAEGWLELSINDTEVVVRLEIPRGSPEDYWFAMTFASNHQCSIVPAAAHSLRSPSMLAAYEAAVSGRTFSSALGTDQTMMLEALKMRMRKILSHHESVSGSSVDRYAAAWETACGSEEHTQCVSITVWPMLVALLTNKEYELVEVVDDAGRAVPLCWSNLLKAACWMASNADKVRRCYRRKLAQDFSAAHGASAPLVAACEMAQATRKPKPEPKQKLNLLVLGSDESGGECFARFHVGQMKDWLEYNASLADPIIPLNEARSIAKLLGIGKTQVSEEQKEREKVQQRKQSSKERERRQQVQWERHDQRRESRSR